MFELVEQQTEIACVRQQNIVREVGRLRLAQCEITAEAPFAKSLNPRELLSKPCQLRIDVGTFALGQHGLVGDEFLPFSITFDFPEPLGPMRTLSGVSSKAGESGGNESRPLSSGFAHFASIDRVCVDA